MDNYQRIIVILLKKPNVQLLVTLDHSQQRTMTSETVDPIDWPLALLFTG